MNKIYRGFDLTIITQALTGDVFVQIFSDGVCLKNCESEDEAMNWIDAELKDRKTRGW